MKLRYKARPQLESFILNQAPAHFPTKEAPNNWDELKRQWARCGPRDRVPVYDGGCDRTIYSHPRYNYAFRAWHDKIHIDLDLSFSKMDELRVCNEHLRQMRDHMAMFNLNDEDSAAIQYDVAGQVLYYYKYKSYVYDQAAFVQACFNEGSLFEVLRSGELY